MTTKDKKELLQFAAALEKTSDLFYSLSGENKWLLEKEFHFREMISRMWACSVYADDIKNIVEGR